MVSNAPQVSVIIPAYNVSRWIGAALQSVRDQTVHDWEVIVVDDGSQDGEALERVVQPGGRVRLLRQMNRGAGAARNLGISEASGQWLAFLDADDTWVRTYLEVQLGEATARELDLVWCDGVVFGETSRANRRVMRAPVDRGIARTADLLEGRLNVITSGTMVRRQLVAGSGGFDAALRRGQDFEFWIRLLAGGAVAGYHRTPLVRYRVREGNLSGDRLARAERAIGVFVHLARQRSLTSEDAVIVNRRLEELRAHRDRELARLALERGDQEEALRALRRAEQGSPSWKQRVALAMVPTVPRLTRVIWRGLARRGAR